MQWHFAIFVFGIGIGSPFEQHLGHRRSIPRHRRMQRRIAIVVFGIDVGSPFEQRLSHRRSLK